MIKIKIIVLNTKLCPPFSCCTSSKIEVTDEKTGQTTKLIYISAQYSEEAVTHMKNFFDGYERLPGSETVVLYSDKDYSEFVKRYEQKFSSREDYNCYIKNCATAGEFALDYFFPQPTCDSYLYTGVRYALGLSCLLTCGMFKCTPSFPCFDTPLDLLRRAKLLAKEYGTKKTESKEEVSIELPVLRSM